MSTWELHYADGSNNVLHVWADAQTVRYRYAPVTPLESSSGTYSGGEPAEGTLGRADADALWQVASALVAAPASHAAARAMGTGALTLTRDGQERRALIRSDALGELQAWVDRLR